MTRTATMTTQQIAMAAWGADASEVVPNAAQPAGHGWVYPDPSGSVTAVCRYTGAFITGWPVRMMTGSEPVIVTADQNAVRFEAESWVIDRRGDELTGREAARVLAVM